MSAAKGRVVVIGAGHNGLVAAGLLARRGLAPLVLERREVVGGAAVTEEFHPGFRASTVAHLAGPLRASLWRDLGLGGRVELLEPEPRLLAPLPEGGGLALYGDPARTAGEIRRFSAADADRYPQFHASLGRIAAFLAGVLEMTPPDVGAPAVRDLWPALRTAVGFRRLGRRDGQRLLRWGPMAVADFAQEWFETDLLRAVVCARGIFGAFAGPWSAGTAANLLLQAAAAGGNGAGSTVQVKGGLGALTAALADVARGHGAEIRTGAAVERILTREGRVTGVVVAGGQEIPARAVVSGADPHRTFLGMMDPASLHPDDLQRLRNYRIQGMASKVNLALEALPVFKGVDPALLHGRIHIGRGVDDLERAFDDAKYGGLSRTPYLDVTIPTLGDPGLAPAGRHVLSVYVQYTPARLREGDWATRRDEVGDVVLRTLEPYAPGLTSRVLHRQVLTPADLESIYGLTGGHPFHGEPSLDQIFTFRPVLGFAGYRTPIEGLFLCGAGTHPGGGVTGASGANAAREVLRTVRPD